MRKASDKRLSGFFVFLAVLLSAQWLFLHLVSRVHLPVPWNAVLPGLAIFSAAFLLSWAAELAQMEIPQALALAILALIAVLPEYAVDMYFAWKAGKDPAYVAYAAANMTGSNRLLIGVGWPTVLFAYWLGTRKREIKLEPAQGIAIVVLFVATLYSFLIPLKGTLSVVDTAFMLILFVLYMVFASRAEHVEPELEGPSEWIATWRIPVRRFIMVLFFFIAGYTIFHAAAPFAEGLLVIGRKTGIEEFLLVQWLAPLASESPEFIVAILFALRGMAGASLGTLVSSKVNQWTLLVGMLPLAYCLSAGRVGAMPMDARQIEELFLTSAQSLFAVSVLANFRFSFWEAVVLLALFGVQLMFPSPHVRYLFAVLYVVLTVLMVVSFSARRQAIWKLFRQGWRSAR